MEPTKLTPSSLRIAAPCNADWNKMEGDYRRRYCAQCKLHVYNFSNMSEAEIATLLQESEGRVCARLYRRKDGTVITKNCPVGARLVRRMRIIGGAVAAVVTFGVYSELRSADPGSPGKISLQHCVDSIVNLSIVQNGIELYERYILRRPTSVMMGEVAPP